MFNFKRQLRKYGRPFVAIVDGIEGYYDDETGKYVPPSKPKEKNMQGIILQLSDDDLKFDDGGTLSVEDRKLLIDTDKHKLTLNQTVLIDGKPFKVHRIADYSL